MFTKIRSFFRKLPLRFQMIIGAALVGTGAIATVGSILIAHDLAKIAPRVQEASSKRTELIAKLSIDALIVEDRPALQTMIDGLKDLETGLVLLKLSDADGDTLAYWKSDQPEEKVLASTHQITHAGQEFGTISMEWSYAHFANPILQAKARSILTTLIALTVLITLLGIVLQYYLINPLQYLERKVRAVTDSSERPIRRPVMIARELRAIEESLDETANTLAEKAQIEAEMLQERSRAESAEAAAQAKMDFLSLMSHEIRTPLGAMMGFGTLLESANLKAEERENLNHLNKSGEFLLRVLNDLLDLSKIEANGVQLEQLPVSPTQLLAEIDTMLKPLANEAGISLEISCENLEEQHFLGDHHRLKQILMNLVGNAIKFTEVGGVTLRAIALDHPEGSEDNIKVRFEVTDTGIGMIPDQCERIFDRFSQADSTTTRKFGGTGLGLSVANELAKKMGSSIAVESTLDVGSEFSFEADFPKAAEPIPQAPLNQTNPETAYQSSSDLRILIAEDECINRLLVEKIFATMGHQVSFACDGQECIDLLGRGIDYDVIFLDLHMPHVGGMEIAQKLRSGAFGEAGEQVKLAIMSADILAEQEGRDIGIDAFISKPINQEKLKQFLGSIHPQSEPQSKTIREREETEPLLPVLPQPTDSAKIRALIVEDHEPNRNLIAQILHRFGVETQFAEDGLECVNLLAETPDIDLILLDLRMPRMDGFTVAEQIRNGDCGNLYKDIPIAIVSAEVFDQERIDGLDISDHIPKPIDIRRLGRFINDVKDDLTLVSLN